MKRPLDDVQRAKHILDAVAEIERYTTDFDLARFEQDSLVRSTTERQLTIIGEAANALTLPTRDQFPHIDWRGIRGFRNIVVHEYFGVSVRMVWAVVIKELEPLKTMASAIVASSGNTR